MFPGEGGPTQGVGQTQEPGARAGRGARSGQSAGRRLCERRGVRPELRIALHRVLRDGELAVSGTTDYL